MRTMKGETGRRPRAGFLEAVAVALHRSLAPFLVASVEAVVP
jgi:hypothetical protein